MWDYEGKLESTKWTKDIQKAILKCRLFSPPAKMLRALIFKVCSFLAPAAPDLDSSAATREGGLLSIIPVGDLEREVDAKLTAATADDDIADLEQWVIPTETRAEANAQVVLRQFASRWWCYFQEKQALA